MSEHASNEHPPAAATFTDAQWEQIRTEDYYAGKAVVVLMLSIFSIGVFLYAAVAYSVWSRVGFLWPIW